MRELFVLLAVATGGACGPPGAPPAAQHRELGELAFRELRYREARNALTRALELDPGDARARRLLERTRWILGDIDHGRPTSPPNAGDRRMSIDEFLQECRKSLKSARASLDAGRREEAAACCERLNEALRWFPYSLGVERELLAGESRALLEEARQP